MVFPLGNNTDSYHEYTFYQGVIVGDLIATFALFMFVQSFHYCVWGHEQQQWEYKRNEEGEGSVEPLPPSEWKWDQRALNMYFPIIFGCHISAVFLPLAYYPSIFTCVVSYVHLACFAGMLINTICLTQKEAGRGGKTITNRVFWIIMCLLNLVLIAAGITGIPTVLQ